MQATKKLESEEDPDTAHKSELIEKFKLAVLRIMKNVNKIKRSANTRFKLLDVIGKYKNQAKTEEEDKKPEDEEEGETKGNRKKRMDDMDEDEAISNEEVYEDYKEFKNLILQTSKIVSEQQAKMDHLLQQLSKIPGIKGQDDGH